MAGTRIPSPPSLQAVLRVLAAEIRLDLLVRLAEEPSDVSTLARGFPWTIPMVSHSLGVLRKAGLVLVEADAQRRIYCLSPLVRVERRRSRIALRIRHCEGSEVRIDLKPKRRQAARRRAK